MSAQPSFACSEPGCYERAPSAASWCVKCAAHFCLKHLTKHTPTLHAVERERLLFGIIRAAYECSDFARL